MIKGITIRRVMTKMLGAVNLRKVLRFISTLPASVAEKCHWQSRSKEYERLHTPYFLSQVKC